MAITIGPGITVGPGITITSVPDYVTSGLLAYVDAGNNASYSGSGTTWTDLSGVGNNFTLTASPPWTSAGSLSYFTMSGGYAVGPAILPATAYTKIAVFYVTGNYSNLISGGVTSTDHAFWGNNSQFLQAGHNSAWNTVVSPVTTPLNQWVFGAVSFNTSTGWRLYLNQNTPVTNASTTTFTPTPAVCEIGAYQNGNFMNGRMAVSMIYNRVLTDGEITQNYNYFQSRFSLA
jgi:hypothetical protein